MLQASRAGDLDGVDACIRARCGAGGDCGDGGDSGGVSLDSGNHPDATKPIGDGGGADRVSVGNAAGPSSRSGARMGDPSSTHSERATATVAASTLRILYI